MIKFPLSSINVQKAHIFVILLKILFLLQSVLSTLCFYYVINNSIINIVLRYALIVELCIFEGTALICSIIIVYFIRRKQKEVTVCINTEMFQTILYLALLFGITRAIMIASIFTVNKGHIMAHHEDEEDHHLHLEISSGYLVNSFLNPIIYIVRRSNLRMFLIKKIGVNKLFARRCRTYHKETSSSSNNWKNIRSYYYFQYLTA